MASGWIKSLQCKSRAFDDVYHPSPKLLMPSNSCRGSSHGVKDVIQTRPGRKNSRPDPNFSRSRTRGTDPDPNVRIRTRRSVSARAPDTVLPALTELPDGHPSRNVVEIIFQSSWSPGEFPGRVEVIFKVENGSRAVTRFEEYREGVKTRAVKYHRLEREEHARCVADGNEMMRFYPLGPTPGNSSGAWAGAWMFPGGKGAAVCTFSGSGEAHVSAGGEAAGRRAVLVCRVVAGRVSKKGGFGLDPDDRFGLDPDDRFGFDSVLAREGELVVFDTRAVLPCFLIIYRL